MKEKRMKDEEEKKRLQEQSNKDRVEKSYEPIKSSKNQCSTVFGANKTGFKDIGVDLNKKGG